MKPVTIIMFGAALLIAFIIAFITYNKLLKKPEAEPKAFLAKPEPVAVAIVDLSWGTKLSEQMIKIVPFLKESLPSGYFSDPSDLAGRTVLYPIKVDEPIFESSLAPTTLEGGGIAAIVRTKKRAMAVKIDKIIGVAGFLNPGNRVDVLVTLKVKTTVQGKQGKEKNVTYSTSKTVLENILVIATGPSLDPGAEPDKPRQVTVATLEVTPEESEKLALAMNEGTISLVLRNYVDTEDVATKGETISSLLASYRKRFETQWAQKEEAGQKIFSIELITGNNVSKVEF